MDSALQTVVTRQENKIKQEMDNVLETTLETVNKDITSATETLTKVKQNADEEKLRESKTCNLITSLSRTTP